MNGLARDLGGVVDQVHDQLADLPFIGWLRLFNLAAAAVLLLVMAVRWRQFRSLPTGRRLLRAGLGVGVLTAGVGSAQSVALSNPHGPASYGVTTFLLITAAGVIADTPTKETSVTLWSRIRTQLQRLRYTEPALLRARYVAAVGVLAALGVTLPGVVDHWVGVALAAVAIAAPYYQGRKTRADVWSQQTVDDLAELVALFPELADRAKQLLGSGSAPSLVRELLEHESTSSPATTTSHRSTP